jgi:hypothetical protein
MQNSEEVIRRPKTNRGIYFSHLLMDSELRRNGPPILLRPPRSHVSYFSDPPPLLLPPVSPNASEVAGAALRAVLSGANVVSGGGNLLDTDTGPLLDLPRSG